MGTPIGTTQNFPSLYGTDTWANVLYNHSLDNFITDLTARLTPTAGNIETMLPSLVVPISIISSSVSQFSFQVDQALLDR